MKRAILLAFAALLAWPEGVDASDHEPPIAVLHGPRGQRQQGGVSGYEWHPRTPGSPPQPCPLHQGPHADVFEPPRERPILVRAGKPLFIRFHKEDQPSSEDPYHPDAVEIRGPRGLLPLTLEPYAPEGQVIAWDAGFTAPRSKSRDYYIAALVRWVDQDCPGFTQWIAWQFSVQKRQVGNN